MKIFWSWQSDPPAKVSREFVKGALHDAVATISMRFVQPSISQA